MAVLKCLVEEHGAVLTGADIHQDGTGTYSVQVPMAAFRPEDE